MLEHALFYANQGIPVFPVAPTGKEPLVHGGFMAATTDLKVIANWWSRWPDANIGIPTGGDFGIVIDIDYHHEGDKSLAELETRYGKLPETRRAKTGRGEHIFFKTVPGLSNSNKNLPQGIDVRGDRKGYVVAPPSVHFTGNTYTWVGEGVNQPLADMPSWLLGLLVQEAAPIVDFSSNLISIKRMGKTTAFGRQILEEQVERLLATPTGQGKRHSAVLSSSIVIGKYVAGGEISEEDARVRLLSAARELHKDGKRPTHELERVIEDGISNGRKQPKGAPDQLPEIVWNPPDLPKILGIAEMHLRARNQLFIRNGQLGQVTQSDGIPQFRMVTAIHLRTLLTEAIRWVTVKENKDGELVNKPILCPKEVADAFYAKGSWDLNNVKFISNCPVIKKNGEIIRANGFDPDSGIFVLAEKEYPNVAEQPVEEDVAHAKAVLLDIIHDFPFESEADRAAAIALIFTVFLRHLIDGAVPMFLVTATVAGTGKGMLADVAAIIGTGRPMPVSPPVRSDELEKRITSAVMADSRLFSIDNVDSTLGSAVLDAALTSSFWTGRLLAKNTQISAPMRMVFVATGNNVQIKGDLGRRTQPVRMLSPVARPEFRTGYIHEDLPRYVTDNRANIVAACLTVARAFLNLPVTSRPAVSTVGSYKEWSDLIRGIVAFLDLGDPGEAAQLFRDENDTDRFSFEFTLRALKKFFGDKMFSAVDLLRVIQSPEMENDRAGARAVVDAFSEFTDDLSKLSVRVLGQWLAKHKRRLVDNFSLEPAGRHAAGVKWRIKNN